MEIHSPNFAFLPDLDPILMHQAALAERYCLDDPSSSLTKLRLYGEFLAKSIAARSGIHTDSQPHQNKILKELKYRDALESKLAYIFHGILTSDAFTQSMKSIFHKTIRRGKI